ncbi:MAG TPA: PspC domain-containing protein [Chloroflexaceae bacterium]|nr:PspC domain-containing protein [Chloroflexaceae bacterium]
MQMNTRLTRSRSDRMIAGVAAGIARYLNTDPTIVRLVFVILALTGPAIFVYPLLWLVMPEEPAPTPGPGGQVFVATGETQRLRVNPMTGAPGDPEQEVPINNLGGAGAPPAAGQGGKVLGYLLLGLGAFIALQMIWPGAAGLIFPAALIAVGVWLLRRGR